MLKFRSLLIFLSGTLILTTACSNDSVRNTSPPVQATAASSSVVPISAPASTPAISLPDPYKLALDKAISAKNISQSAETQDDWSLVVGRWQQAIALLNKVPASSPNKKLVKARLAEYQRRLSDAQKHSRLKDTIVTNPGIIVDPVGSTGALAEALPSQDQGDGRVHRARIKYRRGGIPVIDVTFNGRHRFEMMVDTGASGTMITQEMASTLGVRVVGEVPIGTASGKSMAPVAQLQSIEAGGIGIKNVLVTIGPLDIGLLGHDFFGSCDLVIKRNVVEFSQCGA